MPRPPSLPDAPTTPVMLDAAVLAHGGLTWEREFSETRFERLVEMAVSAQPRVAIKLKFATLEQRPVIQGELQASVDLVCQRCMAAMHYPVRETFELMVIEREDQLTLVPQAYEPWIANALRLDVLALVEEQLLLALPLIAKHADERDCVLAAPLVAASSQPDERALEPASEEVQRPFGHLRDLLR